MCSEESSRNSEGFGPQWDTCCPEKSGIQTRLLSFQLPSCISQQGILWKDYPRAQDPEQGKDGREWS